MTKTLKTIHIYVAILDECVEDWELTTAAVLGEGLYRLQASPSYDAVMDDWEFLPGTIVHLEER